MSYDERMAAILLSDAERRFTREGITLRDVFNAIDALYLEHRDITGVPPNHRRMIRVTEDCWKTSIERGRYFNRPPRKERSERNRSRLTVDQINARDAHLRRHAVDLGGSQKDWD